MLIALLLMLLMASPVWAIEEFTTVIFHSGSIADGDGQTRPVSHYGTLGVDVFISGSATVTVQGRSTLGESFAALRCINTGDGTVATAVTATANVQCPVAGIAEVKTVVSGCSSCLVRSNGRLTTATMAALSTGGGAGGSFDGILRDGTGDTTQANVASGRLKVDGSDVTQPVSGSMTVTQPTGTNLHMVCDSGCSSSAGFSDNAAFTFGTTAVNPIAGVLDDTATNAATENSAAVARITAQKGLHVNLRNNSGTEIGTSGAPVRTDPTGTTTQPVSGTVTANQGGTWTMQPGNTANTTPWLFKLDQTTTNNDVDVISLPALPTGSNTIGGVNLSQYTPVTGRLPVDGSGVTQPVSGSVTVTQGTGTNLHVVCDSGCSSSTSPSYGSAFPSVGTPIGFTDGTNLQPGRVVDADTGAGTVTVQGVNLLKRASGGPVEAGTATDPLRIDPTGSTIQPVSLSQTGTANDVDVASLPANASVNVNQYGGSAVGAGNAVHVQPGTGANFTTTAGGNVAHDAVDSGNPVKIGCHARTTNRTAVADADRADVVCDDNGQLIVTVTAPRDRTVSGSVTLTTTTETTIIAAGGAGVFRDLTDIGCTNGSATLVRADIRDSTAGTVRFSRWLAANGGGFNLALPVPRSQAAANNNWTVQLSGSVTDVRCDAQAVEKN